MNDIISKMRSELRSILKASVEDYSKKPRDKWLFDWPSQIILVVNQIFWCNEVEQVRGSQYYARLSYTHQISPKHVVRLLGDPHLSSIPCSLLVWSLAILNQLCLQQCSSCCFLACPTDFTCISKALVPLLLQAFMDMGKGSKQAMANYNEFQVKQLTRLIEVTRTNLTKPDRQKIMNMITIDAHSRDMVANIVEAGVDKQDCFLWMCQLRSYWDASINDCRIKICDASFPYGYEYLGNGPRLVITPLTDRIYITATQACWLCLGTAPAGPAGG